VLFNYDNEMDNGSVADDGKDYLESVLEEGGSTAADRNRDHEAKSHKGNSWNSDSPGSEVLSV
jgi:hypothetical protein